MGAYLMVIAPGTPVLGGFLFCGCYEGRAYKVEIIGVFTNTTPVDAYRGAGRPEATYAIERAIDALARRVGKDAVEIRRMNFMPPFTEATQSIGGLMIDSGDYPATLDQALELFDYEQLLKEQQARRETRVDQAARDRLLHVPRELRLGTVARDRRACCSTPEAGGRPPPFGATRPGRWSW